MTTLLNRQCFAQMARGLLVVVLMASFYGCSPRRSLEIVVEPAGGGMVVQEPSQARYRAGTTVLLTAAPSEGYMFLGWSGDIEGHNPSYEFVIEKNTRITATFAQAGALRVVLTPENAVTVGAQWRVEGETAWRASGSSIDPLPRGIHNLEFRAAPGWTAPTSTTVDVDAGETYAHTAAYTAVAPDAPAYVEAVAGPQDVLVRWDAQTLYNIAGYHVYRTGESEKSATRLTDAPVRALRYEDTAATPGARYAYQVTAATRDGEESRLSVKAWAIAGDTRLSLPHVSVLPGDIARFPIALENAFGIAGDFLAVELLFSDCETDAPIDVFDISQTIAVTAAITADGIATAYALGTGHIRIEVDGGAATTLIGEGRILELIGEVSPAFALGEMACVHVVSAALQSNGVMVNVTYTQGVVMATDECMPGDVDNNAIIEPADAELVLRIAARHEAPNECRHQAGDLNRDGRINGADATIILRLLDGWYDLPAHDDAPTLADILRAAYPTPVTVSIGTDTAEGDSFVVLPVWTDLAQGIHGGEITITWPHDSELFELDAVEAAPAFQGGVIYVDAARPGVARIFFGRAEEGAADVDERVMLARLRFRLGAPVFDGYIPPVTLQTAHLYGPYGELADWYAPVLWEDGAVTAIPIDVEDDSGGDEEEFEIVPPQTPEKRVIEEGVFMMGRPYEDEGDNDELPVREVFLDAYEMGRYPVTNQEFANILNWAHQRGYLQDSDGGTYTGGIVFAYGQPIVATAGDEENGAIRYSGGRFGVISREGYDDQLFSMANHPAAYVSWYGAVAYCNWLSEFEGLSPCYDTATWTRHEPVRNGYRLPTEAEWERAAAWDPAAGAHRRYGSGSDALDIGRANYSPDEDPANPLDLFGAPLTTPVGWYNGVNPIQVSVPDALTTDSPSPSGLYDMAGNIFEWCHDRYGAYPEGAQTNPTGAETGATRVLRGGAWSSAAYWCRAVFRGSNSHEVLSNAIGFRVALTISGE